jgi:hypoxanthine phosphoribosyltransferase
VYSAGEVGKRGPKEYHMDDISSLIRNCIGFLALLTAFYGLIARERKAPYLVTSMYRLIFLGIALAYTLLIISVLKILPHNLKYTTPHPNQTETAGLLFIATALLSLVSIIVLRDYNRYYRFRSDLLVRHFFTRWTARLLKHQSSPKLNPDFVTSVIANHFGDATKGDTASLRHAMDEGFSISVICQIPNRPSLNEHACKIALDFLHKNCYVQYTSCTRHPIEFVMNLKNELFSGLKLQAQQHNKQFDERAAEETWRRAKGRIILIDAHTPHFGFWEDTYKKRSREAREYCLKLITSRPSYAGIHSAIINGTRTILKEYRRGASEPVLIIYEETSALADVESSEQYRIFLRHVIPSERLMGGLFTVFYEKDISNTDISVIETLPDAFFMLKRVTKMTTPDLINLPPYDIAFSQQEIQQQISRIIPEIKAWANEIQNNTGRPVMAMPILKGGESFFKDISKNLGLPIDSCPLRASSYGTSTQSSKQVHFEYFGPLLRGRDILLIDDICHTGETLRIISNFVKSNGAVSVKTAVAIQRAEDAFQPDWYLFRFQERYPNLSEAWLYGYGMDNGEDEDVRSLPYFVFAKR